MPTVTVLAPDSALAMDEVIRQLGDNAYILATHARDGQVEILATNEPAQIQPPRKRTTSVSFADAVFEQVAQGAETVPTFRSARAEPETAGETAAEPSPTRSATIVTMPQARARPIVAPADEADIGIEPPQEARADTILEPLVLGAAELRTPQMPPEPITESAPTPADQPDERLHPLLRELSAHLARLEAEAASQASPAEIPRDPLEAAGFSAEIVKRLAPGRDVPDRAAHFVAAMAETLVMPDPVRSLRAPVVVIVGPSGAGKTVLAGKIAALTLETQPTRAVELVSLSETPPFGNAPLSIYARMLSIAHRTWQPEQLEPEQLSAPATTRVLDSNLEPETLCQKLIRLRAQIGRSGVAVVVALPVGISSARVRSELEKYAELDPVIALTKLDECELSSEEASLIAEAGTQIAWLSGTRALTETMAPATEEMMTEFLGGLLADRS